MYVLSLFSNNAFITIGSLNQQLIVLQRSQQLELLLGTAEPCMLVLLGRPVVLSTVVYYGIVSGCGSHFHN